MPEEPLEENRKSAGTLPRIDRAFVRAQFPAFAVPELADGPFFENAGGSYACGQVIDRLTRFYRERKMQPDNPYPPSSTATAEMQEARVRIAAMLGVDPDEVSFGPSTSQNVCVLASAFSEWLTPGDAIVVTNQDHEANSGPWRRLSKFGIEIREWKLDPQTGLLNPDDLVSLLDDRVRLVAFPHCSNVIGAINPAAEITRLARDAGAYVCIDGVSYAPHGLPDIGNLGADIYLFSAYKTYGPHQGVMVVRKRLGEELPNQGHGFNRRDLTKKFTPAGPDHAQVAAMAGVADYFDAVYQHHFKEETGPRARADAICRLIRAAETEVMTPLLDYLSNHPSARLLGPARAENRMPTIALWHEQPGYDLARGLANLGIMAGGGDFYAPRPLSALGIRPAHGVLRLSMVHYTSPEDVDRLIDALERVL